MRGTRTRRMRLDNAVESVKTVWRILMERGGLWLFRHIACHAADFPSPVASARAVQPLLPALHNMEHLVSTVQGSPLVHSLRRRTIGIVAVIFLLSRRRMAAPRIHLPRRPLHPCRRLHLYSTAHQLHTENI